MTLVHADGIEFAFPPGWRAAKVDDWSFYRKHFINVQDGIKSVDLMLLPPAPERGGYLVEIKDYRGRRREKSGDIGAEFVGKVMSSLAMLLPARCEARVGAERDFAEAILKVSGIKLILLLEQGRPGNRLFPPVADAANLTQRLRGRMKPIGRVSVLDMAGMGRLTGARMGRVRVQRA